MYDADYCFYQQDSGKNKDAPKQRLGRLLTYTLELGSCTSTVLQQHQQEDVAAILDMKWCHNSLDGTAVLGVVDSAGELSLWHLEQPDDGKVQCIQANKLSAGKDRLALSLDWATGRFDRSVSNPI